MSVTRAMLTGIQFAPIHMCPGLMLKTLALKDRPWLSGRVFPASVVYECAQRRMGNSVGGRSADSLFHKGAPKNYSMLVP